ncbi:tripeptidyl-peptidase I [Capsaspora owczarzaki ATCC 30864]|uniref:Tripeptidyl-peptidase I n=1 Tax=Capsaspora owczarzaki (strain ATCC 30864) TaxID=595528 RepID=A0A0D2X5G8_CAPO3|nr:tripeptidyl-peptidase I [Capsaspora owczarzaki ATCC 30864]KJE97784.1 tripeptidyl-peptidase I [Capsaspora owczarzaki ATCC 30864]|eukprot:XP_004342968.1 tripeptidyl-peptidase I [Capsaspora owczarzaki ATCC 30864]
MQRTLLVLALLAVCAAAAPLGDLAVLDASSAFATTRRLVARPQLAECSTDNGLAHMTFALRLQNKAALHDRLMSVSSPENAEYGKHMTVDEIASIGGITRENERALASQLAAFGAKTFALSQTRTFAYACLPISAAQVLLERQAEALPVGMRHLIHTIVQTRSTMLMEIEPIRLTEAAPAAAEHWKYSRFGGVEAGALGDPNAQKTAYQIPLTQVATNTSLVQMVWGTGTFGYTPADLAQFYSTYNVPNTVNNLHTYGMQGTVNGDNFIEGTLDCTYISGMGVGVQTLIANTDNDSSTEWGPGFGPALLNFVSTLSNQSTLPHVLSMSLGSLSWASCDTLCRDAVSNTGGKQFNYDDCIQYMQSQRQVCMYTSQDETDKINDELLVVALRGVTILAATGDGGSHFSFEPFSDLNKIGRALNVVSCSKNFPTFPAASPYLLGVGGTQWSGTGTPTAPIAWTASGGAFSWQFPMPDYQKAAVAHYLSTTQGLPPANSYNASNRAYPDVAALADNVPIVSAGKVMNVGGTSASTPAFAGIISLLNDIRLNKGLPSLGFVNTRLYQVAAQHPGEAFFDVTVGNTACSSSGFCCDNGFPAAVGYDPTTGLGSPLWPGLVRYLTSD